MVCEKNISCESQLIHTYSDLVQLNNTSIQMDVIIRDFSKSFDAVSYGKLLLKGHAP